MKTTKTFLLVTAVLSLTTACLEDKDNYNAGFPALGTSNQYIYANTATDTFFVYCYNAWQMTQESGNEWCSMEQMSGNGNTNYRILMTLQENTTGQKRLAHFGITDTAYPSKAHYEWEFLQLATRGDGALGNAAMVDSISGTDGSSIKMGYDQRRRPTMLRMVKDEEMLANITIKYNDGSKTMTVVNGNKSMTSAYGNDYQPKRLISGTDTVGLFEQLYFNTFSSSGYAFNIEERQAGGYYSAWAYKVPNMKNDPDSLHTADSLRYQSWQRDQKLVTERLKLNYSPYDNRCQSVDANQLLLGVEHCSPYMLLSMFRYARNSKIVSLASCDKETDNITVATELNADKSIHAMTVTRHGQPITYTFFYINQ